jgi:diguanylate cyclase (GGDEF)-like protein/PAS domain S-box-containing protein
MSSGPRSAADPHPVLALAFEHAPVGVAAASWRGGLSLVAVNPALCDMLGYSEQELLDGDPSAVTHPDDWAVEVEHAKRLVAGEVDSYRIEKRYVRKDGSVFRASLHVAASRDEAGRVAHVVAFVEDMEAARRHEERFRAAANATFDAFSLFQPLRDPDDKIVDFIIEYVNDGAVAAVGLTPADVTGRKFGDFVFPALREPLLVALRDVVETQQPTEGEAPFRFHGSKIWLGYQIVPVGNDGVALAARNVTGRRGAVDALRESEERLAAIVGHAQDAVIVTDRDRVITWVSAAITGMCKYAPEHLADRTWRDLVHPHDLEVFDEHERWTRQHPGEAHRAELRIRCADGHWIWTEDVAMNLDDHPAVNGLVAHVRDITTRKTAEDALRASEERFRALVQNASDLVSVYDDEFVSVYVSPSHHALLGYDLAQVFGAQPRNLVHPEDVARFEHALHLVADEAGRTATCQYRVRHADGSWRRLEAHVSNLLDEPAVRGIVVNARDITEAAEALEVLRDREEWFRSLVQHSWDLVAVLDEDATPVYVSPSHALVLDRQLDEILTTSEQLLHPDDVAAVTDAFLAVRADSTANVRVRYRLRHADGTWRSFEASYTNLLHDPAVRGIVANSRDVTEEAAAVRALRQSEERFATLVRYSSDVVTVAQRDGSVRYVSPAVSHVLGYDETAFGASPLASNVHPDDRSLWDAHFEEVLEYPSREHTLELRLRHADGRWRWMEAHAVNLLDDAAVSGVVVHLHDISERRVAETELEHQALHDPLTGLPNRALVLDRLGRALARGHRSGSRTAVMFLDVDRFKVVNDSLGHAYGDDLLVAVAARLRASLRETDTVARLGGDEFVVLLEDLAHETIALEVADKILDAMRRPFALAGREFFVTASIGLAMSTDDNDTPESMVRDADAAMYVAKGRGRNRLEVFDEAIRVRAVHNLEVENDLHRALDRGELRLVYQPAYELTTNRIVGVEALLRWDHPKRGLVLPGEFIGVAEETGLIIAIGEWVINEACRQLRKWRDEGSMLRTLWVNLSPRQLAVDIPEMVRDALERNNLPRDALGLELTESTLIEEAEAAGSMLRELESVGVRLAIDDFGTGYSSLLYLQRYRVDVLKVDRSFVNGLGTNDDDTAITSAVINLGHNLGMEVSAEGVETPMQLERLRELGCDTACGYYLVRPTTPEAVTQLLRSSAN